MDEEQVDFGKLVREKVLHIIRNSDEADDVYIKALEVAQRIAEWDEVKKRTDQWNKATSTQPPYMYAPLKGTGGGGKVN